MIPVKVAAQKAIGYMHLLFENTSIYGIEEVEITNDNKYWLITVSMADENLPLANVLGAGKRKYKIVQIDSDTGDVKSVKIRKFD